MSIADFLKFLRMAETKEREEQIRAQWVQMLPLMSTGMLKYMSFNDYYDQCTGKNIDMRPTEDIIAEIELIHAKAKERSE